jgi:enoyl-CoA hydratase/carnithine racemase
MGHTKSFEMFCLGKKMSASEAAHRGLVTKTFPKERIREGADEELRKLAKVPARVSWRKTIQYPKWKIIDQ